jgi:multiple sugar transport system permease protein
VTGDVAEMTATAPPIPVTGGAEADPAVRRKGRGPGLLTRRDMVILAVMAGIPAFIHVFFVWVPTLLSVLLSFTSWNGIGGLEKIKVIGIKNYTDLVNIYPPFWPAVQHNLIGVFLLVATPIGIFFAVLLDKDMRGSRFYQSALYLPVVLSLAIVGFIAQLFYAPEQGLLNNILGTTGQNGQPLIDWLGDSSINLWAVLVFASWRHIGYIMILYLAGLKGVDPTLREAAKVDGASEVQTFFRVVFPVMAPINIVVLVITVIESLRAFDLAFIINRGLNGLELLSILVTNNIIGEASRVGFGSAIAVVLLMISVGPIILYLSRAQREFGS